MLFNCESDENIDILNQRNEEVYDLGSVSDPAITGFATFIENSNGSVTIELELSNTIDGEMHPAHLHFNTAVETGAIALTLGTVNGLSGKSSITVTTLDDGTAIDFNALRSFDGYINVHLSDANLTTLVAQGDIGQNDLTGESKSYTLNEVNLSGVSGTANFFERNNGEALAVLELDGLTTGVNYFANLRLNDVMTTGAITFAFNDVNGDTGLSNTNLSSLDVNTDFFGFDELLVYNGYINIEEQDLNTTVIANANIGSNEDVFVPQTISYDVTNVDDTAYIFNGNGLVDAENPNLNFTRGNTYIFNLNVVGQPFYIKTMQGIGTSDSYNDGVTGNGNETGTLEFVVSQTAPDNLFYNSEFTADMAGSITISD
jgi:hypothetical protein